ncbi:MAG: 16S rRNA (uracil(1498)-N(3))-methyltransferase [Candidatus Sedimenticola sp. (ex Thyasira tokunagai)]
MNIVLFDQQDYLNAETIRLIDRRFVHLKKVLRVEEGDQLRVGLINGDMGSARVSQIDHESVELKPILDTPRPPPTPITLVLALSRPKMMRRIYRMVAELGIKELIVVNTQKTEKSFWQSPVVEQQHIYSYLLEGLEQAVDTKVPRVTFKRRFKPFVEDELAEIIGDQPALLAHPGDYPACPVAFKEPMVLAIGPEGGFIPYEVEKLVEAGMQPVTLGPRILRVENAVVTLISRLFDGAG